MHVYLHIYIFIVISRPTSMMYGIDTSLHTHMCVCVTSLERSYIRSNVTRRVGNKQ